MKVKQTTFFCPFSRSSSPLLFHCGRLQDPSRPEEQSQSVSQSNLRSPEGERETQLQHSAPQKGRALAEAPAARGREGRRRGMPQRHASSLRTRVQGQGGGPAQTLPASTAASASRFPTPFARGLRARLPHSAGSAGSGQQTPGRITRAKKKKKKPKPRDWSASRAPRLRISLTPF